MEKPCSFTSTGSVIRKDLEERDSGKGISRNDDAQCVGLAVTRPSQNEVRFHGYSPGVLGKITEAHATYYHENWGFDVSFEAQVGRELSEFMAELKGSKDGFWVATVRGRFAGSIAIDGRRAQREGARLRWFIVLPEFQGVGIGKALITRAVEFCKTRGYTRIYLWSFRGLDVARRLYERYGFRLSQERDVFQWGKNIAEQKFEWHCEDQN
jgi:GNAT superfamily N-acetyltransferase